MDYINESLVQSSRSYLRMQTKKLVASSPRSAMNIISVAVLFTAIAMASGGEIRQYDLNNAKELFETFIKDHSREYKDEADKELHYQAFVTNLREINRLNELNPSATYGINKFADYTDDERKMMRGLKRDSN